MIITRRWAWQFEAEGYAKVKLSDIRHLEVLGVPLCMGREQVTGCASGPWAPGWALSLYKLAAPPKAGAVEALEYETAVKDVVAAALRHPDPREFAEAAEAALRVGGPAALESILRGGTP